MGGQFFTKAREVSQDTIQLLEDLIDRGAVPKDYCENMIRDHQDLLRGITDIPIITEVFTKSHQFLHAQMQTFQDKGEYANSVLCKVMSRRLRDVIVDSLRETQPIDPPEQD